MSDMRIGNNLVGIGSGSGAQALDLEDQQDDSVEDPSLVAIPQKQQPVNFFDNSSYQTGTEDKTVSLGDGKSLTLPSLTAENSELINSHFGNLTPDQQVQVSAAGQKLATAIAPYLKSSSGALDATTASTTAATNASANPDVVLAATNAAQTYVNATGNNNYDTSVTGVALMGVMGLENDMVSFAQTMQGHLNTQNTIRTDATELQQMVADWPDDGSSQTFSWTQLDANGKPETMTNQTLTKQQATDLVDKLNNDLDDMTTTTQMDQINLQNITQNYQQGYSTISNVLKMQAQTTMAIVNNLKA